MFWYSASATMLCGSWSESVESDEALVISITNPHNSKTNISELLLGQKRRFHHQPQTDGIWYPWTRLEWTNSYLPAMKEDRWWIYSKQFFHWVPVP
jgi:hypothetical protein